MVDVVTSTVAAYVADTLTDNMADGEEFGEDEVNQILSDLRSLNSALNGSTGITGPILINNAAGTAHANADDLVIGTTGGSGARYGLSFVTDDSGYGGIYAADASDNDAGFLEFRHSADQWQMGFAGSVAYRWNTAAVSPQTTGGPSCGTSANRWGGVYSTTGDFTGDLTCSSSSVLARFGDAGGSPAIDIVKAAASEGILRFRTAVGANTLGDKRIRHASDEGFTVEHHTGSSWDNLLHFSSSQTTNYYDLYVAGDLIAAADLLVGATSFPGGGSDPAVYVQGSNGSIRAASSGTDATNKTARFEVAHYTNAEEPVGLIHATSTSSSSTIQIGGGSSVSNAATGVQLYAATGVTTLGNSATLMLEVNNGGLGFFGTTPAAQAAAYTPTNVVTDRSYDANSTSVAELADVLGTLIADLQSYGLLQ